MIKKINDYEQFSISELQKYKTKYIVEKRFFFIVTTKITSISFSSSFAIKKKKKNYYQSHTVDQRVARLNDVNCQLQVQSLLNIFSYEKYLRSSQPDPSRKDQISSTPPPVEGYIWDLWSLCCNWGARDAFKGRRALWTLAILWC